MATQTEVELLLVQLRKASISNLLKNIDKSVFGISAALQYLYQADEVVTAGKISEKLDVSTARVAVLLKRMAAKGLIEKETDSSDGRVVVVKLSEHGRETAKKIEDNIHSQVAVMIDKVGLERMMEFADISREIHSVMMAAEIDLD